MFVNSPDKVVILGGSVSYSCVTSGVTSDDFIESVQWLVNGALFEDSEYDNIMVVSGRLRFFRISAGFNNTNIKCRANLMSGSVLTSVAVLLQIQG